MTEMAEFFDEKERNPTATVRQVFTCMKSEQILFKKFAKKIGMPLSVLIRVSVKKYIATEGKNYVTED